MRAIAVPIVVSVLSLTAGLGASQLVLPNRFELPSIRKHQSTQPAQRQQQAPLMPLPNMPPFLGGDGGNNDNDDPGSGGRPAGDLVISDILNSQRKVNIFAGFTRDVDVVSKRIDDKGKNSTILAPANSAIQKLPRKPWEDPKEYEALGANAYEGKDGESRAHRNLRRFVEAHVIEISPWKAGQEVKSMGGGSVKWVEEDGKKVIQPGDIHVIQELQTSNGQVWILDGALNYA